MSNSAGAVAGSPAQSRAAVEVDPAIAVVIGNPAAPMAAPASVWPPTSLPGEVGPLTTVSSIYGFVRHGVQHLEKLHARYGEIYRYMWVAEPSVSVWDADEIQRIVRNEGNVWSAAMGWDALIFDQLDAREGNLGSLLSLDFDRHRVARKLLAPAFTSKAIKGYVDIAAPCFERAVADWSARGHVDFKREARALLARVSSDIFTGLSAPQHVALLDAALVDFWQGVLALSKNPWLSPAFRKARRGFKTLHDFFTGLVSERRERPGADLFSHMCQVDEREGLSDEALVRIFITIMFGAFDTTSVGVTSMAYLLAKHPDWQERLRAEAKQLAGRDLDGASLSKLEQLEWVWKETLRLMPVNAALPRRALREVELCGVRLAAGTFVTPMNGAMGRHPRWWNEPLKFDPERFSPARAEDKRHPAIYLPFGGGAHACIGMQLANIEAKLLFYQLLTHCRIELAPDYEARHVFRPLGCVSGKVRLKLTQIS